MLGTELSLLLEKTGLAFAGTDREVDITNPAALIEFAKNRPFAWIVNCAAYTAVDRAEDDVETCRRLNAAGPGNIAACAKSIGARLMHISTDYVFDGTGIAADGTLRPYREDDTANPIGVYGRTKRDGEIAVMENSPRSYIVRTAWLYGKHGPNFVATMLRLMNERPEVKVVDDQRGSPTWAGDLAAALVEIINAERYGRTVPYGVYHYTNKGNITWFDFAAEIYDAGSRLGLITKDCAVRPCTSAEYPAKVTRPAYSVLDKTKIETALGIAIPTWDESLRRYLRITADETGLAKTMPNLDVRWKQRFENFQKSLEHLSKIVNRYEKPGFTEIETTLCLKYFEMVFELAWKVLKDYLTEKGITGIIGGKDAIRQAFNNGIIDEGEIWLRMVDVRNEIVHTYDEEGAKSICEKIVTIFYNTLRCFSAKMERLL
jgi:dTDP-4-dehydrorhamnose reductase